MTGWKSISTAKSQCEAGIDYLVANATDGAWIATWQVGEYYPDGEFFTHCGIWAANEEVTHWQPLPDPPTKG